MMTKFLSKNKVNESQITQTKASYFDKEDIFVSIISTRSAPGRRTMKACPPKW